MKKLKLQNQSYQHLVADFREWLDILGYASSTVYYLPNHLQEFFYYLEQHQMMSLADVKAEDIQSYYEMLKHRGNETRYGGLSKSYLNKHLQALKKFREYLIQHNAPDRLHIHLQLESNPTEERTNILTQSEVKELFKATLYSHHKEQYRQRDQAILVLLYSCGLRRTEAVSLDVKDILFDTGRIHVRKGKNYKERFVPINRYNLSIIEEYVYDGRFLFTRDSSESLLLNIMGTRLQGMSLSNRLQAIVKATANEQIKAKQITLHTLRHSIATHLLEQEVPLDRIKTFLGHSSLESTQIYTHLLKTLNDE